MTAPTLTPQKLAETARFGIHEVEQLEDALSHDLRCEVCAGCDREPAWHITTRCCGRGSFLCDDHWAERKTWLEVRLAKHGHANCDCGNRVLLPSTVEALYREVQL